MNRFEINLRLSLKFKVGKLFGCISVKRINVSSHVAASCLALCIPIAYENCIAVNRIFGVRFGCIYIMFTHRSIIEREDVF